MTTTITTTPNTHIPTSAHFTAFLFPDFFLNNCDGVVYVSLMENVVFCIAGIIIMGCGHHKVSCIIMQHKMCTCKCKV